jgi:hypothetical protein
MVAHPICATHNPNWCATNSLFSISGAQTRAITVAWNYHSTPPTQPYLQRVDRPRHQQGVKRGVLWAPHHQRVALGGVRWGIAPPNALCCHVMPCQCMFRSCEKLRPACLVSDTHWSGGQGCLIRRVGMEQTPVSVPNSLSRHLLLPRGTAASHCAGVNEAPLSCI